MYTSYKQVSCVEIAEKFKIKKGISDHSYHCFNKDAHKNSDENPSLVIYNDKWKCEACGIGGQNGHYSTNVDLVKTFYNYDKNNAIAWIIDNFHTADNSSDYEEQQYHLRNIKRGKNNRFEIRSEDELSLRDPTEKDILNIEKILRKSFKLETLLKAKVKIQKRKLKSENGEFHHGYALAFPGGTKTIIHNPKNIIHYLEVEGRTDYLSAINNSLEKEYGIISRFNSKSKIDIIGDEHIFIMDRDVNQKDIENRLCYNQSFDARFIRLPEQFKDLCDFFSQSTNGKYNTIMNLLDLIETSPVVTYNPVTEFWESTKDGIKINRRKLIEFLELHGFCKYIIDDKDYIFVRVVDNIVKEVQPFQIKDFVITYIKDLNLNKKDDIRETLINGARQFFAIDFLECLKSKDLDFKRDTKDSALFYFKNCFVTAKADDLSIHSYDDLDGVIWEKRILPHDFTDIDNYDECEYNTFLENISDFEKTDDRYDAMISANGYLLHGYKDKSNTQAIILVDEKIPYDDKEANGGTGKSLFCDAIGHVKNVVVKDGKTFKPDKDFLYQDINFDTEILVLDDVKQKFPFSSIFSVITQDWSIEKKYEALYSSKFKDSPKIVITSNFTILGKGVSYDRRKFEIELADYYNQNQTPLKEFGHILFEGWDKDEWNKFYNFMISCCRVYLKFGLHEYKKISLEKRKLIDSTKQDFVEFADKHIKAPVNKPKNDLFDQFIEEYPDYNNYYFKQNTFTKWVRHYAEFRNWEYNDPAINGVRYYILYKDDDEEIEKE